MITNYINENRDEITSSTAFRKKDVTSLNFKSEIDDEYDVLVLANLSDIIDAALTDMKSEYDVEQFFKLCECDEPILELDFVRSRYEKMEITGNFLESYSDMVNEDFKIEIQSKIRNRILKKYPKRILKPVTKDNDVEVVEPDKNEEE